MGYYLRVQRIHISVPDKIKEQADNLVKEGHYGSFSDMVRIGLRELLQHKQNIDTLQVQIEDWNLADELETFDLGEPQE